MLNRTNSEVYDYNSTTMNYTYTYEDVTDFALGFGIGGKWLSKSGFILELSAGIGRNLFNNNDANYQIIGKGGINLGYRF